ncbi:Ig-like domain-containing protein, partial [Opitutales bacterium]|nr:Ig-like domain-containing protein [Opitutales bacterium]
MKFANTFSNISIVTILAVSMCCSGAKTYAKEQKWDFEYGFKHLNEVGADKYVVENKNLRKYTEWQNPPITYLGPKSNDVDCFLTRKFTFDRPTSATRLKVNLATYNFGGGRVGKASCWASVDGKDWKLVLDNPTPSRIDSYKVFDDDLPKELTGSKELWVQMRLHVSRAPNSSYTLAQFGRSTANAKSNVFEIKAKLETVEEKKPTDFTLSDATVEENKPEGTVVGSFSASSVDKGKYDFRKGLVAWYPFDGNASDMSGNGRHGVFQGGVNLVDGISGQAAEFDGVDGWFRVNQKLSSQHPLTWSFWVKPLESGGFLGQVQGTTRVAPQVYSSIANGQIHWSFYSYTSASNPGNAPVQTTPVSLENRWYHVLVTTTQDGNRFIYLDGKLEDSKSGAAFGQQNNTFAAGSNGLWGHSDSFTKSIMDEIRVYNRALSANEVQALYDLENKTPFWLSSFSGDISIKDLDADAAGNVFASGDFSGTVDFGSTLLTASSSHDAFVMKLSPSGNVIWVKKTDGPGRAHARGLSVDSSGNAYITGQFASGSVRFGNHSLSLQRESDPFFAKLTPDGRWAWANRVGTSAWSGGEGLAVDADGNHIVTGYFYGSSNFGSTRLGSSGWYDAFLGKRDSSGNWLWTNKFGSSSSDFGIDVDIDAQGNLVHLGDFKNTITLAGQKLVSRGGGNLNGNGDMVIGKLDEKGNWLWAKRAGSSSADRGTSIVTDQSGNIYLSGHYSGSADFGPNTLSNSGGKDGVVAKLSPKGDWIWALPVSGSNDVVASHLEFLPSGNLLLAGTFQGTITIGSKTITSSGENDLFMAELTPGGQWVSALRHGGTGNDSATLTRNSSGDVFWGGNYSDGFAFNGQTYTSVGSTKAFVALYANAQPSPNQTPVFTGSSTFTLVDGNGSQDNKLFTLDSNGTLRTAVSFDFETKSSHRIRVRATDENNGTVEKIFVISVTDVAENAAPVFTSSPTAFTRENETFAIDANATDPDGDALTFSLTGGDDREKFTINAATGALSFRSAPDFENPADTDGNNVYLVELSVSDGKLTASQLLA